MNKAKAVTAGQIGTYLEASARAQTTVFYGDLAAHFALPPVTEAWMSHPLSGMFDELDIDDAKKARPFRTALVISKEHNMPGPGFFKTVARLCPKRPQPKTDMARMKMYVAEVTNLFQFYGNTSR